jgi:hypothetical protein
VELDVPERDIDGWRLGGLNAWKHRLHHDCGAGEVRAEPSQGVGNPPADVVPDHVRWADPEDVDQLGEILGEPGGVIPVLGRVRSAHPAQVHRDDGEPVGEPGHDVAPLVPVLRKAVDQQQRGTLAATHVVQPRVLHGRGLRDELALDLSEQDLGVICRHVQVDLRRARSSSVSAGIVAINCATLGRGVSTPSNAASTEEECPQTPSMRSKDDTRTLMAVRCCGAGQSPGSHL